MYRILCVLMVPFCFSCGDDVAEKEVVKEEGISIKINGDEINDETIEIDLDKGDLDKLQNGIADALDEVSESLRSGESSERVEVVDYRELKDILPGKLLGMKRTKHTGERNSFFGFSVSQAEAKYSDDDRELEVNIVDAGNMGIAKLGVAAWAEMDIEKEGDFGYERTVEIDGYKALEKWNVNSERGELIFLYEDRFIITLEGDQIEEDELRKALSRIDYDDLD